MRSRLPSKSRACWFRLHVATVMNPPAGWTEAAVRARGRDRGQCRCRARRGEVGQRDEQVEDCALAAVGGQLLPGLLTHRCSPAVLYAVLADSSQAER